MRSRITEKYVNHSGNTKRIIILMVVVVMLQTTKNENRLRCQNTRDVTTTSFNYAYRKYRKSIFYFSFFFFHNEISFFFFSRLLVRTDKFQINKPRTCRRLKQESISTNRYKSAYNIQYITTIIVIRVLYPPCCIIRISSTGLYSPDYILFYIILYNRDLKQFIFFYIIRHSEIRFCNIIHNKIYYIRCKRAEFYPRQYYVARQTRIGIS